MLPSADELLWLMKYQINALLVGDEKLQQFLAWVNQKSNSVKISRKLAAIRALYFAVGFDATGTRNACVHSQMNSRLFPIGLAQALDTLPPPYRDYDIFFDIMILGEPSLGLTVALAPPSVSDGKFQQLIHQFPSLLKLGEFEEWWQVNGQAWTKQLKAFMIEHRNVGHDWQFSEEQTKRLKQYYDANLLLVDCLNSDCNARPEVKEEIEKTLLLSDRRNRKAH